MVLSLPLMKRNQLWQDLLPLGLFMVLAIVLRFFSFFPSVINHDESTYILIGESLLNGSTYFVDYIDTKPIGIFLIYAGLLTIAGKSIFVLRLLMALWIGATAYGLFRVSELLVHDRNAAWASGVIYLFLTSIFTYYGVNPNTELYFNLFTILALWCLLSGQHWWRYVLAGGLLGIGFMIKYVVLFDALAFGLFLLWRYYRLEKKLILGKLLLMGLTFSLPFLLTLVYYQSIGDVDTLLYYTFEVTKKYPVDTPWWKSLVFVLEFLLRFFPVTFMAIYAWWKLGAQKWKTLIFLWLALDLFIILWPGKLFGHYMIQWMLPLALLGGFYFSQSCPKPNFWQRIPRKWGFRVLAFLAVAVIYFQKLDYFDKTDFPREVAAYLNPKLSEGDVVYTGNYHHIVYFLLDKQSPTAYVHRSLLWDDKNVDALGINIEQETKNILAKAPKFVLLNGDVPDNILAQEIYKNYHQIHQFGDKIRLYEINEDAAVKD